MWVFNIANERLAASVFRGHGHLIGTDTGVHVEELHGLPKVQFASSTLSLAHVNLFVMKCAKFLSVRDRVNESAFNQTDFHVITFPQRLDVNIV